MFYLSILLVFPCTEPDGTWSSDTTCIDIYMCNNWCNDICHYGRLCSTMIKKPKISLEFQLSWHIVYGTCRNLASGQKLRSFTVAIYGLPSAKLISGLWIEYTPAEPVILPFKPINRPLKTDWYNGTTYIRPLCEWHLSKLIKPA